MEAKELVSFMALGALCGLGAFAGTWAGSSARAEPPERATVIEPPRGSHARTSAADELSAAIAELRATVASLESALQRFASAEPLHDGAPRALDPSATRQGEGESIAGALRELATAIDTMRSRLALAPAPLRSRSISDPGNAFGLDSAREAWQREDRTALAAALTALRRQHVAWSYEDALATYGQPDSIHDSSNSMLWSYAIPLADGRKDRVTLRFAQGLLVHVDYEHDVRD